MGFGGEGGLPPIVCGLRGSQGGTRHNPRTEPKGKVGFGAGWNPGCSSGTQGGTIAFAWIYTTVGAHPSKEYIVLL